MSKSWTIFAKRTKDIEDKYRPSIKRAILSFRNSFISDLKGEGKDRALSNLNREVMDEDLTRTVRKIYREAGLMGARLQHSQLPKLSELKKPGKKANGSLGRNEQWIRDVQDYLKLNLLSLVSNMTQTMKEDITRILEKGVENGWSIDQIVTELRRLDLVEARARTIARTEVIRAANVGHAVAAQSMPYETNKKWVAAQDHRTRHSHRFIHNHVVDENDYFSVPIYKGDKKIGSDPMLYPGDPKASAGNTINCRCRALYIPKTDANGNIILRNPNEAPVIQLRPAAQIPAAAASVAAVLKSRVHIGVEENK